MCDCLIQDYYLGSSFETRIISKSLPVTGRKCNTPVNVSEKRKLIDTLFSLTTYLLCKCFLFIDDKYNNEWTNEWIFCYSFSWINRLVNCSYTTKCRRLKLRPGNTFTFFSSTQFSVM